MDAIESYVISISAEKGCYRHIRISADATLFDLHAAILDAFEFCDDHAHAFFMDNRVWSDVNSYYSDQIEGESRFTCDYRLNSMALRVGKQFKYVFDFGDERVFQCKVLRILEESCGVPVVIRSQGKAPEQYPQEEEPGDGEDSDEVAFPEEFPAAKLKKLYAKLALPEATVVLLHTYFDAMASLYGVIPLRKALEIINAQNEPIFEEDFASFAEIVRHEHQYYCILGEDELYTKGKTPAPLDRELVEESLYAPDINDYFEMIKVQQGKPYYIPPKQELLKYAKQGYYEPTRYSRAMLNFLRCQNGMTKAKAEDFVGELQMHASMGEHNFQNVVDDMIRMGLKFKSKKDVGDFARLYTDLSNNSRMALNRGHTPNEISAGLSPENRVPQSVVFGPNITAALRNGDMDLEELRRNILRMQLPNESIRKSMLGELDRIQTAADPASAVAVKKKKIGRNDPCPCGSGKKYKKCCGRDQ